MKTTFLLFCFAFALLSCGKEQLCPQAEKSIPGLVRSISGPDTLSEGKTVALILEVASPDSLCTKGAEGYIVSISNNYIQLGAKLLYAGTGNKHCDCAPVPAVKTLVYFTPNRKGRYTFGTKAPDANMGNTAPDSSEYHVFVP